MPFNPANIIQGPAIVIFNGYSYYAKGDIAVKYNRNTFNVETSMHGRIDERLQSQSVEVSFQPAGEIESIAKYFPYAVADIGTSVFGAVDKTLVIWTFAGKQITWAKAAITKMPALRLKATDTLFGDMTFMCLGKSNTALTDAAAWKAAAAVAFADATFDETKIKTARYTAAYGIAPYDAMESVDGFEIEIGMEVENNTVDAHGIVDAYLKNLTATARMTPIALTEEQLDTLLGLQGAAAILPGESLSKSDTDLVISGTPFTATIHKAGPKSFALAYGLGKNRLGQLEFTSKRTWTAGAANPLFTFIVA